MVVGVWRRDRARHKTGKWRWVKAHWEALKDLPWWVSTLVSVGAAFGTVYAIYAGNPAWGEDGPAAVFALIGATLTARACRASSRPSGIRARRRPRDRGARAGPAPGGAPWPR
jgi:hypothetical protein